MSRSKAVRILCVKKTEKTELTGPGIYSLEIEPKVKIEKVEKIKPEHLNLICDPSQFDFETTEQIADITMLAGQERLVQSMKIGVGIAQKGYNIFALGPSRINKINYIKQFLAEQARNKETPPDICYVNNYKDRYKPVVLQLPAGKGIAMKRHMDQLVDDLIPTLRSAFETEEYQNRKQALQNEVQRGESNSFDELQKKARKKDLALIRTPVGFSFAPAKNGDLMDQSEVNELKEHEREKLDEDIKNLQDELQKLVQKMPSNKRKVREKEKELDKEIATFAIRDQFNKVRKEFEGLIAVQNFLNGAEKDIIENIHKIKSAVTGQAAQMPGIMGAPQMQQADSDDHLFLDRYRVNVLVDHSETQGAPVVYEDNPSYKNLIGRVEYQSTMGAFTTNFNLIKPGALHKANGGYLIVDIRQVLMEPFAWEGLKRALKSGEIKIESFGKSYSMISTVTLNPNPIDLNVKVVLLGERMLYYLLCNMEPEFPDLFKIEADFEDEIDRTPENQITYTTFIAGLIKERSLNHFNREAVARIIEQSARLAGDNEKLSAKTEEISDLLTEASYWAAQNGRNIVQKEDVEKAIDKKIYRSSRIKDKIHESIIRETLFIDTDGERIGQINGLSVSGVGTMLFGRPNRITARVQLGKGDIINIEREVEMSGPIHSKGVLILKGFLGERYGFSQPLALSASLVFEQSYSNIDGDSASSAELYALLSAIGKIPLKQSFSVTGSVNQHGIIQPIGGVNEKIEGFFAVCSDRGLTGNQGVLIPRANKKNLMLRDDIVHAVKSEKFHIYAVETIDEGMELLTGLKPGKADSDGNYPEQSFNGRIEKRLKELAINRRKYIRSENGHT